LASSSIFACSKSAHFMGVSSGSQSGHLPSHSEHPTIFAAERHCFNFPQVEHLCCTLTPPSRNHGQPPEQLLGPLDKLEGLGLGREWIKLHAPYADQIGELGLDRNHTPRNPILGELLKRAPLAGGDQISITQRATLLEDHPFFFGAAIKNPRPRNHRNRLFNHYVYLASFDNRDFGRL